MPCNTSEARTPVQKARQASALERLNKALAAGTVTVKVGANGALAFTGWTDREGQSDLCAYRVLAARNSPELRRAVMRAEVRAGVKVDQRQLAAGTHSHDGGATWHAGH